MSQSSISGSSLALLIECLLSLPADCSLAKHHKCVSISVDLQLAEESEGINQFLDADLVAEVLPKDLEDEHFQHALFFPVRRDEGDDGELL